uniref:MGA conserved domain-containing protein n=1 Tax=Phlebotomus papatasi TaxID=29031 RepID=A0A1B0DDY7_PHLPP
MGLTKWMEKRCASLSKRFGISENVIVARCEREYRKRIKKHRNYLLEWKSFFVNCRVVVKVTPYKKFKQKDRALHRHFNWATILWHKFNGLELQVNDYLAKKRQKAMARKQMKRKRKKPVEKSPQKELPMVILDGDSDVELIEERPVINLESDEEEKSEPAEPSFPKIVSVASAGTVVDTISNVVTDPVPEDVPKPTNDELERARAIFSSLAKENEGETANDDIHSALYSLDDSFGESDGNKSNSHGNRTFLDSLAGKLGVETDNTAKQARNERSFDDCYQELEKTFLKVNQVASKFENTVVKDEDTSSSTEFYGFNENDTQTPGLLPTPVVRQAGSNSAFVSEKCDKLMEKLGPINVDKIAKNKPKKRQVTDEGRINRHSQPPNLECPELPSDMKPRTLAEKKQLLRLKPVGYQVMDQENSVYQLLKKRIKDLPSESLFEQANRIMRQPVPMRRNVWKTATWLNTRQDHYIYRYVKYQGKEIKLFGCVGNFRKKHVSNFNFKLPPRYFVPARKMPCCRILGYPKHIKFNNILREFRERELAIEEIPMKVAEFPETSSSQPVSPIKRKWNLIESRKVPTGPLCTKIKNVEKNENLSPLETYILPRIFLQVSPKINQQFPLKVKRYLNEMCPYEQLTDKWISFALSTLKNAPKLQEPIEFEIPYENDRRKILVSRDHGAGKKRERTTEVFNDEEPLTFNQNLPEDKVTGECAGILEEMINSVAIGMSEDDFSKFDPDLDYSQRESRKRGMSSGKDDCPSFKKPRSSNSLLMELKRLNATIINTENITSQKQCNQEHCKMGCLCDSISSLSYPIGHCEKVKCMFECVCNKGLVINNSAVNPFSKEVFRMRDKAISRLAQAEKDFTSTVVLTNNNTFLLSNSSEEKSKRNRTVPRKFGDYVRTEVQEDVNEWRENDSSVKFNLGKKGHQSLMSSRAVHPQIEGMRHVSVTLVPIGKIVDYMETWCMVHELYRCFCNGEAVTGKPFVLEKISDNCIALSEELVAKPGNYRTSSHKTKIFLEPDAPRPRELSFVAASSPEKTIAEPVQPKSGSSYWKPPNDPEEEMINEFLKNVKNARRRIYKRGELDRHMLKGTSARCIAFDKSTQHALNRLNAPRVKKFISTMERTPKILTLLRRRYVESVCKSKKELLDQLKCQKPQILQERTPERKKEEAARSSETRTIEEYSVFDEPEQIDQPHSTPAWKENENMRNTEQPGFPVIASVTSLGAATSMVSEASSSGNSTPRLSVHEDDVRKTLLDKLNLMVSRMMTTISKNEEKAYLDAPQVNKITTFRWVNLLKEYRAFRLHLWEVHYPKQNYVIITRENRPPTMPEGYTEIIELRKSKKAPNTYFACMITISYNVNSITNLAALLFGHTDYWQVMGFMKKGIENSQESMKFLSVSKETHPGVADKITKLYDILLAKVKATTNVSPPPVKSNVKLMTKEEVKKASLLKFPLPSELGQRWFMLLIANDFSDISHPKWGQMLSYDRISYAISMSAINGRTVQVKSNNSMSLNPSVYVAPGQSDKIFIGPYEFDEECNIILYQRLDGNILLREDYEKLTKVQRKNSTMGCWIQLKPGQRGGAPEVNREIVISNPQTPELKDTTSQPSTEEKQDEDCVVVEADPKEIREAEDAHEAETAVNAILPGGLKLPTEEPKKPMPNPVEKEVQSATVEEPQTVQAKELPSLPMDIVRIQKLAEESLRKSIESKINSRKRKSSLEPVIDDLSKFKIKDLTIFPLSENEESSDWDGSNSSAIPASITILSMDTENSLEKAPDMSFPVISKVESLGEAEKTAQVKQPQQSLLKSNQSLSQSPNSTQNDDSEDQKTSNKAQTPFEQIFAEYLETKTDYPLPVIPQVVPYVPQKIYKRRKTICCTDSGMDRTIPTPSPKLTFEQSNPKKVVEMPQENSIKDKDSIKIVSISCGPTSTVETVVVRSEIARVVEKNTPEPIRRTKSTSTTTIGTVQSSLTNLQENLMVSLKSMPNCVTVGQTVLQKVCGTTSTTTATKNVVVTTSTASTSTTTKTPMQIVNSVTLGQTVLQKMHTKTSAATVAVNTSAKNVTGSSTLTTSITAKPIPIVVNNGMGNQMMKVRINGPTSSNTVILPKNAIMTTPKTSPIAVPRIVATASAEPVPGTSKTTPLVATTTSSVKPPLLITHPDGNKTVTFTRTTADGKDIKYVLPVTKVSSSAIKIVPASQKTPLAIATVPQITKKATIGSKTITLVQGTSIPSTSTAIVSTVENPVPSGSMKSDVIELSDEEDSNGQKIVQIKPHSTTTNPIISAQILKDIMKTNEIAGWVVSNIPQLGYIQARKTDNMMYYYIELPTRKHPFKVGCNCLDRYLDR